MKLKCEDCEYECETWAEADKHERSKQGHWMQLKDRRSA